MYYLKWKNIHVCLPHNIFWCFWFRSFFHSTASEQMKCNTMNVSFISPIWLRGNSNSLLASFVVEYVDFNYFRHFKGMTGTETAESTDTFLLITERIEVFWRIENVRIKNWQYRENQLRSSLFKLLRCEPDFLSFDFLGTIKK